MTTVEIPHARIFVERSGEEGDPLVLVHGSWVDHRAWGLVAPILSGSVRVLSYDRRSHGESTGDLRAHPVRDDAEDLAALLVATDHYPAHVVGHSYGGCVALRLAADHPELVRGIVVHEAPCLGFLEDDPATAGEAAELRRMVASLQTEIRTGSVEEAARAFVTTFAQDPTGWDRLAPQWKAAFVRNAPRWLEEFSDPDVDRPDATGLDEFLGPVLLTEGSDSPRFLHRMTDALRPHLRNGYVQVLRDAGHFPHLTHPALYVGFLHRFLVERDVPAM